MKNSVIIEWFFRLFRTLKCWFENSGYYKAWIAVMNFFGRLYNNSLINTLFSKEKNESVVKYSLFAKLVNKFARVADICIGSPCRKLIKYSKKSFFCKFANFMFYNWQYINVRYYGVFLFAFGAVSLAIDRAVHGFISNRWIVITFFALIISAINSSVSVIINGEFFIKLFKLSPFKNARTVEIKSTESLAIALISGAVFGATSINSFLQLILVGIVALAVLSVKHQWVIFLSVVLLPFLPTMALVGMMLFAFFISFIKFAASEKKELDFDGFDLAMLGFVAMNIYGVLISSTPVVSAKIAAVYIAFILFFFVLRRFLANKKNFSVTMDCFIFSASLVAGYGIIEQIFGLSKTTWQDTEMFNEISGRVCSTFENPNVLGEFFLISIPITIARMFLSKTSKCKLLVLVSLAMQILCMIFTYSRGCWLGLIFATVIFLALCAKKLFVAMSLGVFAIPFVIPQSILDRLLSIGNTADTSTAYRVFIWQGTLRMLRDKWLYGIGLGTEAFNNVYPLYALSAVTAPHPHNLFLQILSETGFIGVLMFVFALIMFFRNTAIICGNSIYRPFGVALGVAMGGYLLQGMFDNVWYNYRIYALFIIILAVAAALKDISTTDKDKIINN